MQTPELMQVYCRRFNDLNLQYMVTGSVATTLFGQPRLTNDVDVVLRLTMQEVEAFAAAFPLSDFYCPPVSVLKMECQRPLRGHFYLIQHDTGYRADIYLPGSDEFMSWALGNTVVFSVGDVPVSVAPPEYVLVSKLVYYREGKSEKHLRDLRGMMRELGSLNDAIVRGQVERLGLESEYALLQNDVR